MTEDARFEDAAERPLRLRALDVEDLRVISSFIQDAVFPITEMQWNRRKRHLAILLNRFRWERGEGEAERVQSLLVISDVLKIGTQGIDRSDHETVLSILSATFEGGEDGGGRVVLTLAGDGAVGAEVEALEVTLQDVTRPYRAVSGKIPRHPD